MDERLTQNLFNIRKKENSFLLALKELRNLFRTRFQEEAQSLSLISRITKLESFQHLDFVKELNTLNVDDRIDALSLIYTEWDKKIGYSVMKNPKVIEGIQLELSKLRLGHLLDTWHYISIQMSGRVLEFSNLLRKKIFLLKWIERKDQTLDFYLYLDNIPDILYDVSNLKQYLIGAD